MRLGTGNQHFSRKADLLEVLRIARGRLRAGLLEDARFYLFLYQEAYARAPGSTRRRWKCGR